MAATELVSLDEARNYLKSPANEDTRVNGLLRRASTWVENHTGRHFLVREIYEYRDGGFRDLFLTHRPIVGTPTVLDTETGEEVVGFLIHPEEGRLHSRFGFAPGPDRWYVTYQTGYGADASEVPEDVRQAVLLLVAHWYARPDGATSEHLGDYQYSAEPGIPKQVYELLAPYEELHF